MTKLVITDNDFSDTAIEEYLAAQAGIELAIFQSRLPEDIIVNAQGADGILTSYGEFNAAVMKALPHLKVISRTGTGYDTIDVAAATKAGVAICTVPDYGTEVVSDHAIALSLDRLRRVSTLDRMLREGTWQYQDARPLGQVQGRTFGIVGMGNIGRAVARKASGLGFEVICCSRSLKTGERTTEGYGIVSYEELLERADVISFHIALSDDTHHLLNADKIALVRPGSIIVNTSRGAVIDTVALAEALTAGKLWGAGIDVFENEPLERDHPLLLAPNTVLTPHVAYWSEESGRELRTRTTQNALDVLSGRHPRNILNPEVLG